MKVIKGICAGLAAFFVVYLLGAFYSAGFDIGLWIDPIRFTVAVMGGCVAFAAFAAAMEH